MAITGSCLCGGVRFEIEKASGPFEICHCNRCRKVSGGSSMPALEVDKADFRFTAGEELIHTFEAPMLYGPPAYIVPFCSTCGSPLPLPRDEFDSLEIPAGLLDTDPKVKPDKHIFVEFMPAWDRISDDLPTFTLEQIHEHRSGKKVPPGFEKKPHGS